MPNPHDCIHEDMLLKHNRTIERLDAEMDYKKEKLDDLKESNRRMEEKIDDIKDCVNELIVKSKTDDDMLDKRLIAIETRQDVLDKASDDNRADFNTKLSIITLIFLALTFYFNFLK